MQGSGGLQYAAGPEAVDINDLVPGDWGVAVLEGGAFLDDFSKAFLLGWAAWHLYTDAVVLRASAARPGRRTCRSSSRRPTRCSRGWTTAGGEEEGGGTSTADQFANMWRDSRKYGIWLHLVTQSPALIPPGILSSCNNLFAAQLKNPKDRDAGHGGPARSEKGFVDEPWRRFLASIPVAAAVVKLGYRSTAPGWSRSTSSRCCWRRGSRAMRRLSEGWKLRRKKRIRIQAHWEHP